MWKFILLTGPALLSLTEGLCHNYEKDYYEELGCKPESTDDSKCPTSYDCSSVIQRDQDKCYYQGKAYDQGHKLETTPTSECLVECRCVTSSRPQNKVAFNCVSIECPELFFGPPQPGCYYTYKHGKCCHIDKICNDTAEKKTPKPVCEYKSETYQLGQKMYPEEEPCVECICQEGYNGSFVEPFCRKVRCNLELIDGHHIAEGCIPIYYGQKGCCPIDWRCPDKADSVVAVEPKSDPKAKSDSEKTCKFGNLTLAIGDKLSPSSEKGDAMECTCRVPPHPICIQKERQP